MKVFKNYVRVRYPDRTSELREFYPGDECPEDLLGVVDPNNLEDDGLDDEEPVQKKINYATLGKEDLVALCADRGLKATGNKGDLVARLKASDGALS